MADSITQQNDAYYNSAFGETGVIPGGAVITESPNEPDANVVVYFDTITSHSVQLNSNITDNWLENSTVVNDCVALPPLTVTLSGLSAELVYSPSNYRDFIDQFWNTTNTQLTQEFIKAQGLEYEITNKLGAITALYPPLDNITQTAINIKNAVEGNVKRYKAIYDRFTNKNNQTTNNFAVNTPNGIAQTRLQEIYENLSSLRIARSALIVVTPYATFENMYIQSISLTQNNLNHITDISLTLKQLSFSETQTTKADPNTLAKFNQAARAEIENHGAIQGQNSTLYNVFTPGADYVNANSK